MSTWRSAPAVLRVSQLLPQTHLTVTVAYSGWISAFIGHSLGLGRLPGRPAGTRRKRLLSGRHAVQELLVALVGREALDQELHRLHDVQLVQVLAQDPRPVDLRLVEQELLFP